MLSKLSSYPFVSIVILTYNGKKYIDECLNSVKTSNIHENDLKLL